MIGGGVLAAGVVALTVRMLVSLAVVLAVVAVGYVVARRRAGRAIPRRVPGRRPALRHFTAGDKLSRASAKSGLEVVGRIGLTRGAAAVALRFGDRVVLVAAGETGSASLIAEMPAFEWDEAQIVREPLEFPAQRAGTAPSVDPTTRPGLLEALRTATSRRAAPGGLAGRSFDASRGSDQCRPAS